MMDGDRLDTLFILCYWSEDSDQKIWNQKEIILNLASAESADLRWIYKINQTDFIWPNFST